MHHKKEMKHTEKKEKKHHKKEKITMHDREMDRKNLAKARKAR